MARTRKSQSRKSGRRIKGNGRWNISFSSEWGPVLKSLGDLEFLANDWKPAFKILADKIAAGASKAIKSGVGPDGYTWRELDPQYARSKGSRAMLRLSGKLQGIAGNANRATKLLTNNRLKFVVNAPYATVHQFGAMPTGEFPGARVRNYLIWGDDLLELTRKTLNDYAEERIRKIAGS